MERHIDNAFFEWKNVKEEGYLEITFRLKKAAFKLIALWLLFDMVMMFIQKESYISIGIYGIIFVAVLYQAFKKDEKESDFQLKWKSRNRIK